MTLLFSPSLTILSFISFGQESIKIMLITSERKIPDQEFFTVFERMSGVEYTESIQPKANEWIESGQADEFDVLVFYDLYDSITPKQKKSYCTLLEKGQPMLFLHHTLVSYQNWPEFKKIIGGKYYRNHPKRGPSTFQHNVELTTYNH